MQFTLKGKHGETVEFEDVAKNSGPYLARRYRMVVTGSNGVKKADVEIDVEDIKRLAKAS
jgi:hypothetical protein